MSRLGRILAPRAYGFSAELPGSPCDRHARRNWRTPTSARTGEFYRTFRTRHDIPEARIKIPRDIELAFADLQTDEARTANQARAAWRLRATPSAPMAVNINTALAGSGTAGAMSGSVVT